MTKSACTRRTCRLSGLGLRKVRIWRRRGKVHKIFYYLHNKGGLLDRSWKIYWGCFQTMPSSSSSSVAASSALRERRKNLTSTTLAGQNIHKLALSILKTNVWPSLTQGQPSWLVWAMGPISTNFPENYQLQAKTNFISKSSKAWSLNIFFVWLWIITSISIIYFSFSGTFCLFPAMTAMAGRWTTSKLHSIIISHLLTILVHLCKRCSWFLTCFYLPCQLSIHTLGRRDFWDLRPFRQKDKNIHYRAKN